MHGEVAKTLGTGVPDRGASDPDPDLLHLVGLGDLLDLLRLGGLDRAADRLHAAGAQDVPLVVRGPDEEGETHEVQEREEERVHDRHADQNGHLEEEGQEAGEHERTRARRRDRASEDGGAHVLDRKGGALGARLEAVVVRLGVDVRQVNDVVDGVADHDHAGDRLGDPEVPAHGALAEAQDAQHDEGHGGHGVGREHKVPRGDEDDDERAGEGDGATREQAGDQLGPQIEVPELVRRHLEALERRRRPRARPLHEVGHHVAHLHAGAEGLEVRQRGPQDHGHELELPVDDADVLHVVRLDELAVRVGAQRGGVRLGAEQQQRRQERGARGQRRAVQPELHVLQEAGHAHQGALAHRKLARAEVPAPLQIARDVPHVLAHLEDALLRLRRGDVERGVVDGFPGLVVRLVGVHGCEVQVLDAPDEGHLVEGLEVGLVGALDDELGEVGPHVVVGEPLLHRARRRELAREVRPLGADAQHDGDQGARHHVEAARGAGPGLHQRKVGLLDEPLHDERDAATLAGLPVGAQGRLPRGGVRAAAALSLEAKLVDHEASRREGYHEDVVHEDADRGVPAAGAHGHHPGDGHGQEGDRSGERGPKHGAAGPQPRDAQGAVDVVRVLRVGRDVPPAVHEHEDVVRADAQHQVDREDVQEIEVVHHEDLPVDDAGDRQRGQDLEHPDARHEAGPQVRPHAQVDEDERDDGKAKVRPDHLREIVELVEDPDLEAA
mmetsp:Transcript_13187/g.34823  ORF Transcript_13187/g.34823 Transcript_13187/m.34823 type:complete len:725 (+) Transcript_13187:247-2421(+)